MPIRQCYFGVLRPVANSATTLQRRHGTQTADGVDRMRRATTFGNLNPVRRRSWVSAARARAANAPSCEN